ncbi:MAG: DEAD/DEAH box helicase [Candidatus Lokiarchaeota archaeon]|nr:DEAD/DEAH box helicase [Candidatus Lokiarchaeota archaeon]
MKLFNKLKLLYIPATYWNEPSSGFKLISKGKQLPQNTNFFLLWIPSNNSEKELTEHIKLIFPNIPIKKLLSCKINLAIPFSSSKKVFEVISHIGKIIPILPATKLLYQMEIIENPDRSRIHYSNSIKIWALLTKLVFELLNKGQFVPALEPTKEKLYNSQWRLILKSQYDNDRFKSILNHSSWPAFCLPINNFQENGVIKTNGLWHPSYLFSVFLDSVGDSLIRSTLNKSKFQTFDEFYSAEIKKEVNPDFRLNWDYKFLKALVKKDNSFKVDEFYESILPALIQNWTQSALGFQLRYDFALSLELKYPEKAEDDWSLKISLSSHDGTKTIPLNELWEGHELKTEIFSKIIESDEHYLEIILRALGAASKIFPPIKRAFLENIQHEIKLTSSEVMEFLKYPKDLLIQSGFNIVLPEVFTIGGKQRLTARLIIRSNEDAKKKRGLTSVLPSIFDIDSMLNTKWDARIEGKKITEEEFNNLIDSNEPLVNLRGKWILIDQNDVEDLRNIKKFGVKNYLDALKIGLIGKVQLQENGTKYDVIVEGELNEIITRIQSIDSFEEIPCPSSFNGKLRRYQEVALKWMGNMTKLNFGLCLADDMGLGKTIQVIAFLLYLKEKYPNNKGSVLVVCPTSVLFNWHREFNKFAPNLEIILHHGPNRYKKASEIPEFLKAHRIFLTSYGTIRNDIDFLETIPFSGIIIDESQNMKNYTSKQTQAISKLKSQYRICLSGTPIENRLLELWSLFNFLNPGLLGNREEFQEKFILPIERFQNQEAINDLKTIIAPFIMRRVKSDKSIINDLPEKNEIKITIELTKEQVILYKDLTEETIKKIEDNTVDKRNKRGIILALLVKLKQICNHPYQYLKKDITSIRTDKEIKQIISQSNKLVRLLEMTDEVISNGEKVLIFTQFTQMGTIIKKILEWKYNFKILFFHGSVPEKKRSEIIDDFQSEEIESPPILILSLKAGGTGLNLTQGTTVIHFDRWWNPAVEDQATDRAYRIGQTQPVNVYKFVTIGTIEEKIDSLLEEKKDLADKIVVSTGESWISDLNKEKLKELLLLSN